MLESLSARASCHAVARCGHALRALVLSQRIRFVRSKGFPVPLAGISARIPAGGPWSFGSPQEYQHDVVCQPGSEPYIWWSGLTQGPQAFPPLWTNIWATSRMSSRVQEGLVTSTVYAQPDTERGLLTLVSQVRILPGPRSLVASRYLVHVAAAEQRCPSRHSVRTVECSKCVKRAKSQSAGDT